MKIAWVAPYPEQLLEPQLQVSRKLAAYHPCSWITNLSQALARLPDVQLHLVTESRLVTCDQMVESGNIKFHFVKGGVPFTNRGFPRWLPLDALTGFKLSSRRLLRAIRRISPDLVHAHGTENSYALTVLASGLPCLISIQGIVTEYYKTNPSFGFRLLRHWEQRAVRQAHNFTCRTRFDSGFVRGINPSARIFMIDEAMSPVFFEDRWTLGAGHRILFVGSLAERKGLPTLLQALPEVCRAVPDAGVDVIGGSDPAYLQRIQALCEQLGIAGRVAFLGQCTSQEIARKHLQTQLFVLPSLNENSPNSLAEAMVSGMPVIATNVGGIPSMIQDGETGLLVPPLAAPALAQAIIRLFTQPQERARLGANARRVAVERHRPDRVAEQTLRAYKEILRR